MCMSHSFLMPFPLPFSFHAQRIEGEREGRREGGRSKQVVHLYEQTAVFFVQKPDGFLYGRPTGSLLLNQKVLLLTDTDQLGPLFRNQMALLFERPATSVV